MNYSERSNLKLADKKVYLDQEGLEKVVRYIHNELAFKLDKTDFDNLDLENIVHQADLADYAKKNEVVVELPDDVVREADLADVVHSADIENLATKDELAEINAKASSAYHVKGSVANLEALQAVEDPHQGDVYNLEDTGINAVWTGSEWDEFGTFVDTSALLEEEDVYPIDMPTVDSILYSGKSAIVSDRDGIAAMLANDEPEVEIKLNQNLSIDNYVTVPAGKSVTFDLGGNKLSGNSYLVSCAGGNITLKNGTVESSARPVHVSSGELTLDGADVTSINDVAINVVGENAKVVMNSGKVTAQESGLLVTTGAKLEMNGGEVECFDNCPIQGNGTVKDGNDQGHIEVVMNGGKLTAHIQSNGYTACGVYMPNSGKFIMNGGEIVSDGAGLVMRAGEVELNGGSIVANGVSGSKGKVGDSRVVVGPYAVVYDESAKYPGVANGEFKLTIGQNMVLQGTDGDVETLLSSGAVANIIDNR